MPTESQSELCLAHVTPLYEVLGTLMPLVASSCGLLGGALVLGTLHRGRGAQPGDGECSPLHSHIQDCQYVFFLSKSVGA